MVELAIRLDESVCCPKPQEPVVPVPVPAEPVDLLTEIATAVSEADPVRANRRITASHRHLSLALREVTGADAGANFHTWAVWG